MMQINVNIPEDLLERLPEEISKDTVPNLIATAFAEWVAWLDSSFRPLSISELETRRIFELYNRVLVDEVPSADRLGEMLDLPMVRARYVMQNLAHRHGALLRRRRAQALYDALEGQNGRSSRITAS